jgi:hypothetical protein
VRVSSLMKVGVLEKAPATDTLASCSQLTFEEPQGACASGANLALVCPDRMHLYAVACNAGAALLTWLQ